MKVIDLLNKIANGEEVPKKIKFEDEVFEFENGMYMSETNDYLEDYTDYTMLNNEVEIIEENKKIEKLYIRDRANDILIGKSEKICYATESLVNKEIALKINEIIDYLEEKE